MSAKNKLQKNSTKESNDITSFVLVTDERYSILFNIFKEKCIGEISLYNNEDNGIIDGEFKSNGKKSLKYDWKWAHKVYYSYQRLTSMIGKNEIDGYFENRNEEFLYIFEGLSKEDLEIIECIIIEHNIVFKCENNNLFVNEISNLTHNYYSAWERVAMKSHPYCNDYEAYLRGAKEQLSHMKFHFKEYLIDDNACSLVDGAILNIESFTKDNDLRNYLLNLHNKYFQLN